MSCKTHVGCSQAASCCSVRQQRGSSHSAHGASHTLFRFHDSPSDAKPCLAEPCPPVEPCPADGAEGAFPGVEARAGCCTSNGCCICNMQRPVSVCVRYRGPPCRGRMPASLLRMPAQKRLPPAHCNGSWHPRPPSGDGGAVIPTTTTATAESDVSVSSGAVSDDSGAK